MNEQKAIEACEAALEIEPEDAVALYNNIDALLMQERVEETMDTTPPSSLTHAAQAALQPISDRNANASA